MKSWWSKVVKDYFTFSARERNGLLVFLVIITAVILISRYYPVKRPVVSKDNFQQELAHLKISIDSSKSSSGYHRYDEENNQDYAQPKHYDYSKPFKGELFAFDPNTLDESGWRKLGLRDKTISTIEKFVGKGFHFRHPDDLRKIYGLRPEDADRLIPYVHIAAKEGYKTNAYSASYSAPASSAPAPAISKPRVIDINTADTSAFIALPGIGSKLAARIVNFRQKLGGFSFVNQLGETYGIPDSTFQRIKPRLQCNNPELKKININTAEVDELRTHPYLRWNIANAIVNYRKQHGNYKSVEDLRKIDIITEDLYNKIAPYLVI